MSDGDSSLVPDPDRRQLIQAGVGLVAVGLVPGSRASPRAMAVRLWPAAEYTRVTLEQDTPFKFHHFLLTDTQPARLVVDIDGIESAGPLQDQLRGISLDDPYIARMRAGVHQPGVVRLVIELKTAVAPQVFALDPVGPYQHRLVLDLYPEHNDDPLMALLQPGDGKAAGRAPAAADASPAQDEPSTAKPAPGSQPVRRDSSNRRIVTIAIDPGHGGEDPGAIGHRGTFEKDVTLSIGRLLASLIQDGSDFRVLMTRDADYFVPLGTRVLKAREVQADLFVSIHADAWVRADARGSSVFALSQSGATSSAAAELARQQNDADRIGGINLAAHNPLLSRVLLDLSTSAQISDSLRFGDAVLHEVEHINPLHRGFVEQAGFAVLKAPDIPSILVETAFISNPEEEARLRDQSYQKRMATAVFAGIRNYFSVNPPAGRSPIG